MAVEDDERLFSELDRQLTEVRTACDGLATRSGLLVAAIAAVAAVLAPRIDPARHEILLALTATALCIAVVSGTATLVPWLKVGPDRVALQSWVSKSTAKTSRKLYLTKLVILDANRDRLLVTRILFTIQAIATIFAVGLALAYTAWR